MKRPKNYLNTYRKMLLLKINRFPGEVFSRSDLTLDHSNREQLRLNRALKFFIATNHIIKITHGLYAKAESLTFNNQTKSVLRKSFEEVAVETLNKLGIKWEYGNAINQYNRGESTQIPTAFIIHLKSRFRGTISAEGRKVIFEDNVYAR